MSYIYKRRIIYWISRKHFYQFSALGIYSFLFICLLFLQAGLLIWWITVTISAYRDINEASFFN